MRQKVSGVFYNERVLGDNRPIRELPFFVAGETVSGKFHIFYGRP